MLHRKYEAVLLGGAVPPGYKLLVPSDYDDELAEAHLEEIDMEDKRSSRKGGSSTSSLRDVLSKTLEEAKATRAEKLSLLKAREETRAREVALQERRLQVEEERARSQAKKDELMLRMMLKLVNAKGCEDTLLSDESA